MTSERESASTDSGLVKLTHILSRVIGTLETLKREAAEVTRKVDETDLIMAEVEQVTREYLPLAQASSAMFFALDELHLLNRFYQFSLRFFLDIFDYALLRNPSLQGVTDPHRRLDILLNDLFLNVFKRTSRALLHSDHLTLAVLLAQIRLRGQAADFDETEFAFLLDGGDNALSNAASSDVAILDEVQRRRLHAYSRLPCFESVQHHIESNEAVWKAVLNSTAPEAQIPVIWSDISRECRRIEYSVDPLTPRASCIVGIAPYSHHQMSASRPPSAGPRVFRHDSLPTRHL